MTTLRRLVVLAAGATFALAGCGSDSNTTTEASSAAADSGLTTVASAPATPTTVYSRDGDSGTGSIVAESSSAGTIPPSTAATAPPTTIKAATATTKTAAPTSVGTATTAVATATTKATTPTTASTTAPTTATTTATSGSSGKATVSLGDTTLGKVLVNNDGRTLYLFTNDTATSSACSGGCATAWPPLIASGADTVGSGLDASKLGTVTRADGSKQVTYGGNPLYTYGADQASGETKGHQVGSVWFAVGADGKAASGGTGTGY